MSSHVPLLGKTPLVINLDETSVPVPLTDVAGTVMVQSGPAGRASLPRQRATKGNTRMYFTHVATICNVPAMQPIFVLM